MKTLIGTSLSAAALVAAMLVAAPVSAQQAMSMDQLLRAVEKGRVQDNKEAQEREAKFRCGPGRSGAAAEGSPGREDGCGKPQRQLSRLKQKRTRPSSRLCRLSSTWPRVRSKSCSA